MQIVTHKTLTINKHNLMLLSITYTEIGNTRTKETGEMKE